MNGAVVQGLGRSTTSRALPRWPEEAADLPEHTQDEAAIAGHPADGATIGVDDGAVVLRRDRLRPPDGRQLTGDLREDPTTVAQPGLRLAHQEPGQPEEVAVSRIEGRR